MSAFDGRVALVTGAAQGLGREIAQRLCAGGAHVLVADLDEPRAGEAAAEIARGGSAAAIALDVRSEPAFEAALATAVERWGALDILVNSAALTRSTGIWDVTEGEWDDVYATNARGTFYGCRVAGAHMRERGYGRIVNMTSLGGQWGQGRNGVHYASSKAAIGSITRVFAHQLAGDGVTVNAIAPSLIDGPNVRAVPREALDQALESVPVGRVGRPDEVAEVAAWLASEEVGYMTGATLDVNGGVLMR